MEKKIKNFIGIDIGGTKTRGVLVYSERSRSVDGKKILRTREIKTPQTRAGFERGLQKLIKELSKNRKIAGIGIGTAGVVSGTILRFSPNIPKIKNFDFQKLWDRIPQLRVDNDARCFARGEHILGGGKGFKRAFFLTIGTGVGRAYGKDRKILKIKKFEYPEHWERKYQKIRDTKNDTKLTEFLGKYLAKLMKPYKPQAVIVGGGVALDRKNFISKLKNSLVKNGLHAEVLKSRLGTNAAPLGAALLF